jgi:pimeloyl-ACP methyl ester carboxylesterase
MAPNASDVKDLKLCLNPAKRRALSMLLGSIISHMRFKIEQSFNPSSDAEIEPLFVGSRTPRDQSFQDPEEEARQRRLEVRLERSLSTPRLQELKKAALSYFDKWSNEVHQQFKKICEGSEDPRSEQQRREWQVTRNPPPPAYTRSSDLESETPELEAQIQAKELEEAKEVTLLQSQYHPIPTRLTTISKEDRICVISCMVLLLLSLGHYSAHSRVLLCYLTSAFAVPLSVLTTEEEEIAKTLMLASKTLTADAETQKRQADNASSRRWKVGLASVAGAALIGVTGGLAAPIVAGAIGGIMGGVGLGGVASFLGIFAMNGALVGTLFGAFGGKMTGEMVDKYSKEVEDFKFIPIASEWGEFATKEEVEVQARRLRVTIGVNGWLTAKDEVVKPWRILGQDSEVFALRYEMEALVELGTSLQSMVSSYAWSFVKLEILKRTVLATLWSALWPVYLLKMATSIDNPFAVARNRSEKAGEVLADALINKAQGERPVTLIGYSLGSRVIYSCLRSLAERKAFGLIENVVLIGSPIPSTPDNWRAMRSVVSGRIYNVYSNNDYILAFLYRATSIQFGVAGLQAVADVEGVSNLDLSKEVSGHLRYPDLIGKILKRAGFEGIAVEDMDIEADVGEIQLVDAETEGMKVDADAVQLRSQVDVLRVVGGEPVVTNTQVATTPIPGLARWEIRHGPSRRIDGRASHSTCSNQCSIYTSTHNIEHRNTNLHSRNVRPHSRTSKHKQHSLKTSTPHPTTVYPTSSNPG